MCRVSFDLIKRKGRKKRLFYGVSVYVFNGATRIRYNNVLSTSGGTGMAARNLGCILFTTWRKIVRRQDYAPSFLPYFMIFQSAQQNIEKSEIWCKIKKSLVQ